MNGNKYLMITLLKTGGAAKTMANSQTRIKLRRDLVAVHHWRALNGNTITKNLKAVVCKQKQIALKLCY